MPVRTMNGGEWRRYPACAQLCLLINSICINRMGHFKHRKTFLSLYHALLWLYPWKINEIEYSLKNKMFLVFTVTLSITDHSLAYNQYTRIPSSASARFTWKRNISQKYISVTGFILNLRPFRMRGSWKFRVQVSVSFPYWCYIHMYKFPSPFPIDVIYICTSFRLLSL